MSSLAERFAGRIHGWYQLPIELIGVYVLASTLGYLIAWRSDSPDRWEPTALVQAVVLSLLVRFGASSSAIVAAGVIVPICTLTLFVSYLAVHAADLADNFWLVLRYDLVWLLAGVVPGSAAGTAWALFRRMHVKLLPWNLPVARW